MTLQRKFGAVLDLIGVAWLIAAFWWEGHALACVATGIILIITGEVIAYDPEKMAAAKAAKATESKPSKPEYHLTETEKNND